MRPSLQQFVLGGAPLGGLFAEVDEETAQATLAQAWELGVRRFDTAPHYGLGISESRLGRFLSDFPREDFAISTKVGRILEVADGFVDGADHYFGTPALARRFDFTRDGVMRSLEASLTRLGTDRADLVFIHDPDEHWQQAIDCAYPTLMQLKDEGVVGKVGVGMNQTEMLVRFLNHADLDVLMVAGRYTLLDHSARNELLPRCQDAGVKVMAAGVFNSGILANPMGQPKFDYVDAPRELVDRALRIQEVCERCSISLRAAAMRYPILHPAVEAVVVGARSPGEVDQDIRDWTTDVPQVLWSGLRAGGFLPLG